jgi:hypothetical protein
MGNWLSDSKPDNVAPPVITSSLPVAPTVATQTPQPATDFIQHLNATGSTGVSTMEARTKKRKRPYKPVYPKTKRPRTSQPLRSGSGVPIQTVSDSTALRNSNDIPFPVADAVEYADEIEAREEKERLEQSEEEELESLRTGIPRPPRLTTGVGPVAAPISFKVKTGTVTNTVAKLEQAELAKELAKLRAESGLANLFGDD